MPSDLFYKMRVGVVIPLLGKVKRWCVARQRMCEWARWDPKRVLRRWMKSKNSRSRSPSVNIPLFKGVSLSFWRRPSAFLERCYSSDADSFFSKVYEVERIADRGLRGCFLKLLKRPSAFLERCYPSTKGELVSVEFYLFLFSNVEYF